MGGGEFLCPEKSSPQHVNRYVSIGRKEEDSFQKGNKKAEGWRGTAPWHTDRTHDKTSPFNDDTELPSLSVCSGFLYTPA